VFRTDKENKKMGLGWRIRLGGPFYIGGTIFRTRRRKKGSNRKVYHGTLASGWKCQHNHSREDLAKACAERELRRRAND
jgi:hypothetical protein